MQADREVRCAALSVRCVRVIIRILAKIDIAIIGGYAAMRRLRYSLAVIRLAYELWLERGYK